MDTQDVAQKLELLGALKERKHERELQLARLELSADPSIKIEIERYSKEIAKVEGELNNEVRRDPAILQAWWQKKEATYSQILEHLSSMLRYHLKVCSNDLKETNFSQEYMKELSSENTKAYAYLERLTIMGAYVVNDETIQSLKRMKDDLEGNYDESYYDNFARFATAIEMCLDDIRAYAKADLLNQ